MTDAPVWLAVPAVVGSLAVGAYAVGVVDRVAARLIAGQATPVRRLLGLPLAQAAVWVRQQRVSTERPDAPLLALSAAGYAALAAAAVTVVPLSAGWVVADLRAGIVLWGAVEALAIVAVFLHGWAPNSLFPLVGGYRFVAQALSYELLSMFVLIAAALPARSLAVSDIVASQEAVWNVVRQPLGLPLWLVVTVGVAFWGPLNLPDGDDLAGGTSAEASGTDRLLWEAARGAMITAFAAMGAAVFLGGYLGPVLPGWAWMATKTLVLIVVVVACRHVVARVAMERFVLAGWTVLLPLAFLDLVIAGVEALPGSGT